MAASYVIGVTGGIATGKSTVMAILAELGVETIDADPVYRDLIQPGLPLWERLRRRFGDGIVADDGQIDRKGLAKIAFGKPDKLRMLDDLTHPAVVAEVGRRAAASQAEVVAVEAVKLIESGMTTLCDELWLVVAPPDVQRDRLIARNDLTPEEADRRIAAQPDEAARRHVADHVIVNSGAPGALRAAVEERWRSLPIHTTPEPSASILPK